VQVRANNPARVQTSLDRTPLGRTGKPEDIGRPAILRLSDGLTASWQGMLEADCQSRRLCGNPKINSSGRQLLTTC
jgi:hypothetical protein